MEGVIYMYTSPSGKRYIGQTVNEERRRAKFLNLNMKYGGPKIDNARRKYSPENFDYKVLMKVITEEGDTVESLKNYLDQLEIGFIKMYNTVENGYNCTKGGGGVLGYHPTEDTKHKLSESHIGRRLSEDTKQKISEAGKGRISNRKGVHLSEETKQKISEAHKRHIQTTLPNENELW